MTSMWSQVRTLGVLTKYDMTNGRALIERQGAELTVITSLMAP